MTVELSQEGLIELTGICTLEDAEKLQQYLIADAQALVDWRGCTAAHTAVIQILLAAGPVLRGPPEGSFLRAFVDSLFAPAAR